MTKRNVVKSQIWLVTAGFSCNNNCVMCSVRPMRESHLDRTTDEIIKDFMTGRKLGYNQVGLTGGEPTIRPDILHLIETAKNLGYEKIGLNTNARMLSYSAFCEKMVKGGLSKVIFTINGCSRQMFDAIADTSGAFNQAIQGVKNILSYPGIEISANTVVFKMNYKHLKEIGKFISRLGVKSWHLLDLIPDGSAKEIYRTSLVPIIELSRSLNNLDETTANFEKMVFFDFPLCLFSSEMRANPKNIFITAKSHLEITKQVGYQPVRFEESAEGDYQDIHKKRLGVCRKCKFSDVCAGVWKDYLILRGERETEYLARINRCVG